MPTRRAFVAAGALAVAGCTTAGDDGEPTDTDTDADADAPTDAATPTDDGRRVAYVLRSGGVPGEFASATAEVRAVFVADAGDLGPCYPEVFEGPYKPTITPVGTPSGGCSRSEAVSVDLVETDERTLEAVAPADAAGHALVATAVVGTDREGESVTAIRNTGGARLLEVGSPPDGRYGVELGIEPADEGADYDYWFVAERVDP